MIIPINGTTFFATDVRNAFMTTVKVSYLTYENVCLSLHFGSANVKMVCGILQKRVTAKFGSES